MSKINARGQLSGAIGPVYYRILNGKPIVQSKPGKGNVKQGKGTKAAASDFGNASRTAKNIRLGLMPVLMGMADKTMITRFTGKVYAAANANTGQPKGNRTLYTGDPSLLEGFEFNTASPFAKMCSLSPSVMHNAAQQAVITVPAFIPLETLRPAALANQCELCFFVLTVDPISGVAVTSEMFRYAFALGSEVVAGGQWTTAAIPTGHLTIITASLIYGHTVSFTLNSAQLHPAKILCVLA